MSAGRGRTAARRSDRSRWFIGGAVLAAIVIAAIVAIVATSGDDATTDAGTDGLEQTRPATIDGAPLAEFTLTSQDPAVGTLAPSVSGESFDGTVIDIEPGEATLVVFLAHWCPHCQREVPELVDWAASGEVPDDVKVIGVASGTSPDRPNYPPSAWLEREQFPFPVIADTESAEIAAAFGLSGYPYFVKLDETGRVVERASGELGLEAIADLASRSS